MLKYFITFFCLISCVSIKTKVLKNNITKVPSASSYFEKNYRSKLEVGIPKNIDTKSLYVEEFYTNISKKKYYRTDGWKTIYKFYANGNISSFYKRNKTNLNSIDLDLAIEGDRGICSKIKNNWQLDIIAPINDSYDIGTYKYKFIDIQKDTIKLQRIDKKNLSAIYVFSRKNTSGKISDYEANW